MQENGKKSLSLYRIPTDLETFLHMEFIWHLKFKELSNITPRKRTLFWIFSGILFNLILHEGSCILRVVMNMHELFSELTDRRLDLDQIMNLSSSIFVETIREVKS